MGKKIEVQIITRLDGDHDRTKQEKMNPNYNSKFLDRVAEESQ